MFIEFLMQLATNGTQVIVPAGADPNLGATVAIITSAGGIIGVVINFLKSKQAKEFADMGIKWGIVGTQKATEAKAAVLKLTPEEKAELKKEIAEEVKVGMKQVETAKAQTKLDPATLDIPRESRDTRPTKSLTD